MGLDTTHDCWSGSYGSFARWRRAVAACIGIELDRMHGHFRGSRMSDGSWAAWDTNNHLVSVNPPMSWDGVVDPLRHLLCHSDCDGHLDVETLLPIAERLEDIKHIMPVSPDWDMQETTQRFIDGLRRAARAGERVEFH